MAKYITLWKIILTAAIVSILGAMTLTDWGSWVAISGGAIAVIGGIIWFCTWVKNLIGRKKLFIPEEKMPQLYASVLPQKIEYMLRMKHNTYVEFLHIGFYGEGGVPQIRGLYDYQGKEKENLIVYPLENQMLDGNWWFWGYKVQRHRHNKSLITVGIEILATDFFEGHLEFQMTSNDAKKVRSVPFKVLKRELEK